MPSPCFVVCFISFPHLLGKTEEECSFHTLKALFPSRKWATEDTKITVTWSNADDMGIISFWYASCLLYVTCNVLSCFYFILNIYFIYLNQNHSVMLLVGQSDPGHCIRQEVWYLQLFPWVLYLRMSVSCNKFPAVTHDQLKGPFCTMPS